MKAIISRLLCVSTLVFLLMPNVTLAKNALALDVDVYLNDQLLMKELIKTQSGQTSAINSKDTLVFEVTPSVENDLVSLVASIHELKEGQLTKIAEPKLTFEIGKSATIEVGTEGEAVYKIAINAQRR